MSDGTILVTAMTFEEVKSIREACLTHAEELLTAAKQLEGQAPHLAYHLATLGLEEIGKVQILMIEVSPGRPEDALRSLERMREDHVKKLFWALWGPTFTTQKLTGDQIRGFQGLANTIHEIRLAGLYVDWRGGSLSIPRAAVSPERAHNLIEILEARLGLERTGELREPSAEDRVLASWFAAAARDNEQAQLIFGRKSMEKLQGLGDAHAWIAWLREQFEEANRASRELLKRELERPEPGDAERGEPKWRVRIRLFTPTHSVRQGVLARFSAGSKYLQLHASGKPNELIVDFILPKGLHIHWLWDAGLSMAERLILAFNVGSFGFFWWQPVRYTATYFEQVEDVEAAAQVRVERVPKLEVNWGRNVLDEKTLRRVILAFASVPLPPRQRSEEDPYRHYLNGLAFFGKTDVHLQLEANAFEGFYKAFKMAAKLHGDWDGESPFAEAATRIIDRLAPDAGSWREFVTIGEAMVGGGDLPRPLNLGDAAGMKVWCDFYLVKTFDRLMTERRKATGEVGETGPGEVEAGPTDTM